MSSTASSSSQQKEVRVRVEVVRLGRGDHPPEPDIEELPFDHNSTIVDLTNLRATALPDFTPFKQLQKLICRQNYLTSFSATQSHCPHITELDLFENRISDLSRTSVDEDGKTREIVWPTGLVSLDLSHNNIKYLPGSSEQSSSAASSSTSKSSKDSSAPASAAAAAPASAASSTPASSVATPPLGVQLPHLRELFLVSNSIRSLGGGVLNGLKRLRQLEVGSNSIRKIEGLDGCTALEELWLGRNKITTIENLEPVAGTLKKLSLQSNRLTGTIGTGLQQCRKLQELYLSHNALTSAVGLNTLVSLTTLDLSGNKLTTLVGCGLESLVKLQEFWLNDNAFEQWDAIQSVLQALKESIITVYMEGNPVVKLQSPDDYQRKMKGLIPKLQQLDADMF